MRVAFRALGAVLLAGIVACSGRPSGFVPRDADPRPWDRPVNGAVATTGWHEDGQPTAPFGPGGPAWENPEQLLRAMAASLARDDLETSAALASENGAGTVTGWIRVFGLGAEPEIAADLRVDMRGDAGSWVVANLQSRVHCAARLVDGECGP